MEGERRRRECNQYFPLVTQEEVIFFKLDSSPDLSQFSETFFLFSYILSRSFDFWFDFCMFSSYLGAMDGVDLWTSRSVISSGWSDILLDVTLTFVPHVVNTVGHIRERARIRG